MFCTVSCASAGEGLLAIGFGGKQIVSAGSCTVYDAIVGAIVRGEILLFWDREQLLRKKGWAARAMPESPPAPLETAQPSFRRRTLSN